MNIELLCLALFFGIIGTILVLKVAFWFIRLVSTLLFGTKFVWLILLALLLSGVGTPLALFIIALMIIRKK